MSASVRRERVEPGDRSVGLAPGTHFGFVVGEVVLAGALLLLGVAAYAHPGPFPTDVGVEQGVQSQLLHRGVLTDALEGISTLNWPQPVAVTLALIVVLFLCLRRWLDAVITPVAAGTESLVTQRLSQAIHRPRPFGHGVHPIQHITSSYSFPSGHVTYAVTVYGLFLFLTYQLRRDVHPALILLVRVVLVALIVLMPVSRVLEGEHWPSDTLGGVLGGLFWLVLFSHLYLWAGHRWPGLLGRNEL